MQLLQHFKELTIRPKNAEELKGLILQLAIQGKLTADWRAKNKGFEPASELLKQVSLEKENLVKQKKFKKDKALPKISKEEIPFGIAKTWVWTRLGEIGTTNVGLTYKPAHKNEIGVPVLRSSNIQEGELCLQDLVRVNTDYREKDIIEEGDLLICARNGSRRLVGKCTIIGQIDEIMVFGAFMAIFRSKFNPYLQLFIQSPQYRSKLDGVETTTINQITQGNLKATAVPLPPVEEQKEIVKVVETLFKEVEQLEQLTVARIGLKEDFVTSALNQLTTINAKQEWTFLQDHFKSFFNETTNIKKLREAVLQLAVQGKLTVDWRANNPDTEDASQLLKRIQKEKTQLIKDKKIKKEKALPPITKDEIPYDLPVGWVWCRMQEIGLFERGKSKHRPRNDFRLFSDGKYPLVQTGDVSSAKKNGGIINTHKSLYNNFGLAQSRMWDKGTLCITIAANIAETGILGFNACFPDSVVGFTEIIDNGNSLASYVEYFITIMKSDLEKFAPSTAQKNINLGILYQLKFPLPPLEEQKAIVKKVNALMGLCDRLEQEVQQSQAHSEMMMQSVLREVFEKESKTVAV
ncbi:restriction endonuclease subunit S [Psychroserpens ponticola]|uniref:Restriction endonuclease subunit S n=1 Tax=Psychroserpens ponticola TaxID=2932268 RepID=A0ABY7RXZ3_9FLAO|nr:restriction endonuclease subunit S [Psychroserpens ponticola]WCO00570.1 restriction endonuclease subunit S [Psychroserpens ponticola]